MSYSDSTPSVNYGFDRRGRQMVVTNGPTICHWTLNDQGELVVESYTGGPLNGLSVTNGYDQYLRRMSLSVDNQAGTMSSTSYGYDTVSRLQSVSDGTNTALYGYVENSPLVGNIVFQHNGQTVMTTSKQYDYVNRLTSIGTSRSQFSPVATFAYNYNPASQRTAVTNVDNSYWQYQYDSLGQVISGKKYGADGTPVAGQQFTYNFDDIGNRKSTASGGDATGNNLRVANYTANNLNQYTSRGVPGYATVLGSANPNATVTVNLQRAVRQGGYFWDELPENNSTSSLYLSLTNLAVLNNGTNADIITTNVGNLFLPQTPETFGYDADGNMTNNGRWAITWDAENRAVSFTTPTNAPLASQQKVDCAYDWQGRRIQKIVSTNDGSAWIPVSTNKFVYDGWNLIAILDAQSSMLDSFTWGTDLSGSQRGAGGVGGLLTMTASGINAGTYAYCYDGNGNVSSLVNTANGSTAAQFEYGPFGEVIHQTGPMAKANPIRFSTKFQDDESDFIYYGFRYYNSTTGRWLNRDPLDEQSGLNVYCFVANDPIGRGDVNGMWDFGFNQLGQVLLDAVSGPVVSAGQSGANWVKSYITSFNKYARTKFTGSFQNREEIKFGTYVKVVFGVTASVSSDCHCVTVTGGGFVQGQIKVPLPPPMPPGFSIAGNITGGADGIYYKYCADSGVVQFSGRFYVGLNLGLRYGWEIPSPTSAFKFEAFVEGGAYVQYQYLYPDGPGSVAFGGYLRYDLDAKIGNFTRRYEGRFTYGTGSSPGGLF